MRYINPLIIARISANRLEKEKKKERKKKHREYYYKNRERILAYLKEYRERDREKTREYHREYMRKKRAEEREKILIKKRKNDINFIKGRDVIEKKIFNKEDLKYIKSLLIKKELA